MWHQYNNIVHSNSHYLIFFTVNILLLLCSQFLLVGCDQIVSNSDVLPNKTPQRVVYLEPDQQADGILVKFTNITGQSNRARSLRAAGLTVSGRFRSVSGLRVTQVEKGFSINESLALLSHDPNIAYAEPNYLYTIDLIPNDADFALQYGLNSQANADINAPEAWDITTGDKSIIVAVIDSGVAYNHLDLRNQIWINPGEIANNGIDDDNNGFIDDVRGWDFADNDNDPIDPNSHGTHVAGIIGAQSNNNSGISGVSWNIQIMALKFMTANGLGSTSAAISAIEYAVANGARISNNSWGGSGFSQALFDVIQSASQKGHLFIAAAGNNGVNTDTTPHYPSAYRLSNIISVAATDRNNALATFSNFGIQSVDLAAPGFQIHSTVPNDQYQALSGTSMAAPFVSGVAALLLSQNNQLTATELKEAILDSAVRLPNLSGRILTGGKLNAFAAINAVPTGPGTPTPSTPANPASPQILPLTTTNLTIGQSVQLNAVGGDGNYTWRKNNIRVTLTQAGLLTAENLGTANISVKDGAGVISPVLTVTVVNQTTTLSIQPINLTTMNLTDEVQLSVSGGASPYVWTTLNPRIVSISPSGSVQRIASIAANQVGVFSVTVTDSNGLNIRSQQIQVSAAPLTLSGGLASFRIGQTSLFSAAGGTSPYNWTSSRNTVARVNSSGNVTALNNGVATIQVADAVGATESVSIEVISTAGNISGNMEITPPQAIVKVGARVRLKVTGSSSAILTWSSSDPDTVSIASNGIVSANAAGIARITATDINNNSAIASIDVREVSITAPVLVVNAGETLQLNAQGGLPPYRWEVSNRAIANIDNTGLLSTTTGIVGGVLITSTDVDGISDSVIISVSKSL